MLRSSMRFYATLPLLALLAQAVPSASLKAVPPALVPWIPWVLRDAADETCPGGRCLALTTMSVDVRGARADFTLAGWRWSEGFVELPGDTSLWPEAVRGASGALPVVAKDETPVVRLGAGPFRISGSIRWTRRPASIPLPGEAALARLSVDGRAVASSDGELWLRREEAVEEEVADTAGSLEVHVFRKVQDGIPVRLETRLVLSVSGKPRRLDIPGVLPPGSLPVELESELPARLSREGRLSITARPGTWEIQVSSDWLVPPGSFQASSSQEPWPDQEVWSFEAAPALRTVQIEGASAIDARQAGVSPRYQSLPAWSIPRGGSLEVRQILRGDPMTDSVKMGIRRSVWVDFEGGGATVVDMLDGEVLKPVRLSVVEGFRLGRGIVDGEGVVLTSTGAKEQGFPLVAGRHSVRLVSRWNGGSWSALPATPTGWEHTSGRMEVQVGPGWRLLELLGPGRSYGTWASEWNLWSIFLVVVASTLVARLAGKRAGILAAMLFVLGVSDGIGTGWWVHLVLVLLVWNLVRARFPGSKPEMAMRVWSGVAALYLVVVLVPFTIEQVRLAVHPSLSAVGGQSMDYIQAMSGGAFEKQEEAAPAPEAPAAAMQNSVMDQVQATDGLLGEEVDPAQAQAVDAILAKGVDAKRWDRMASGSVRGMRSKAMLAKPKPKDDPFLLGGVQSGPGEPTWNYGTGAIEWEGPVSPSQQVRILALSPVWVRLWRVLLVAGAWGLGWLLLRAALPEAVAGIRPALGRKMSVLPLVLLAAAGARAEMPSGEMLSQLRAHVLKTEACEGSCARVGEARLSVRGEVAALELEVHATARAEVGLPEASWLPEGLVVPRGAAGRDANMGSWAVVEPGIQTIRMTGRIQGGDLLLNFPEGSVPFRRRVVAPGWSREGDDPGSVHLVRVAGAAKATEQEADSSEAELAPLVTITRTLDLQREWTMETRIERASGFAGAIVLDVPRVAGETVLGSQSVDSQHVKVVLSPGQDELSWTSRLAVGPRVFLKAESTSLWTETWIVESAARWHVEATGLPRIQADRPTWKPLGGETLSVAVDAPKALEGAMFTIESARMRVEAGQGTSQVTLGATVLAGIGGEILVRLPEGARVGSVSVGGVSLNPLKSTDGRYRVAVAPGTNLIELTWLQEGIGRFFRRAPEVELSAAGTNVTVELVEPNSGWIVAMGGPGVGPAVLWWGVIASMLLIAAVLSRIPGQPLGFWSWFLLFLGTSTVGKLTVIPFAIWVVAMLLRSRVHPERWPAARFVLLQVSIGALTVLAWGWLLATIPQGLLGRPDMLVASPLGEHAWFVDRMGGTMPRPWEFVLPLWWWRGLLLVWCLWLVRDSMKWGVWGWNAFSKGGIWPAKPETPSSPAKDPAPPEADTTDGTGKGAP